LPIPTFSVMLPPPQIAAGAVPASPVDLVMHATSVTQVVLIVLACLSLLSWGIIFGVWRALGKASGAAERFSREFDQAQRLDEAGALAKRSAPNALSRLFLRAMHFVSDARVANQQLRERATPVGDMPAAATMSGSQI